MSNYELYEKVITAFKEEMDKFDAAARNWVEGAESVDFNNAEANELFGQAKMHCKTWRSNAINSRYAKVQMIDCIRKLAAMDLPNPYPKEEIQEDANEYGVDPQQVKLEDENEAISGWTEKPEKKVVLGIVEEEKKLFGRRKKR